MDDERRYYGKFRGQVTDTNDPASLGRIKVKLDAFPGWKDNWCMPCVPYAGKNVGWFVIPEIGARVWIEFEEGNPDRAIWTGCFWEAQTIPEGATPSRKVWKTPTSQLVLDDLDGKAGTLELNTTTRSDQKVSIRFDDTGITITAKDAKITMAMDSGITIAYPEGKLEITAQQTKASLGSSSSLTITQQDQTLQSGSITVQAANQLSVSASSSTSVTTGQYSLKGSTITLQGAAINLG
jgi:uncharacterized protein involved in type VI secretion and phage assembly